MELQERCDKACAILRLTRDGDVLDIRDLSLVEHAVNGFLTDEGYALFEDLYQRVTNGTYTIPWFHGIENMTIDAEGYVYWKGQSIEHFSFPYAWSSKAAAYLKDLAERCKQLEANNIKVNTTTVVWNWPDSLSKGR